MARIFISYSRKNDSFARQLAASLSDLGADVWIDIEDIPAGMKWSSAIQQGLDLSEVMLVILSPDSMASSNVEDEWQYYLDQKKPIIPVLVEPAKVHFQLSRVQYIDFHTQPYEAALRQLYAELRRKGIELNPLPAPAVVTSAPPPQPALPVITPAVATPSVSNRFPLSSRAGLAVIGAVLLVIVVVVALLNNQGESPDDASATLTSIAALSTTVFTDTPPPPSDTPEVTPTAESTDLVIIPTVAGTDAPIGGGSGQIAYASNYVIYTINLADSSVRQVTLQADSGQFPVWSPDGKQILYSSRGALYLVNPDGSNSRRLISGTNYYEDAAWSPDSQSIAVSTIPKGVSERDLFIMKADGSDLRQLTTNLSEDRHPTWSPDGQKIIFHSNRTGQYGLYEIDATCETSQECEAHVRSLSILGSFPAWSPDGKWIAFQSNRDGDYEIYIVDSNDLNLRQITVNGDEDRRPAWSPDSQFIAYQGDTAAGDFEIFTYSMQSQSFSQVTNNTASDTDPSWQP